MILAIDMGNSNIVVGGIDDKRTYFEERITTDDRKTSLEYAIMLKNILEIHRVKRGDIEGSILSSVVPPLNAPLSSAVKKITGKRPLLVGSGMKTGLNIKMDNPKAVGGDRIVAAVAAIAKQGGLYIEVGGGIRDEDRIRRYLDLGVGRCILGTIAVKDFAFTERMAEKYGDRIAVGVDARDGYVAVSGWKELSAEKGVDFCCRLRDAGVKTVIYTDISRDGAEAGTNLDLYRELAEIDGLDITASGGVSSIEELKELQRIGIKAAILGKALYTGRLDLKTVIREVGAC